MEGRHKTSQCYCTDIQETQPRAILKAIAHSKMWHRPGFGTALNSASRARWLWNYTFFNLKHKPSLGLGKSSWDSHFGFICRGDTVLPSGQCLMVNTQFDTECSKSTGSYSVISQSYRLLAVENFHRRNTIGDL